MQSRKTRYLLIVMMVIWGLGCGLVSQIGELRSTAEAVSTSVESGREILGTGQAFVTQVGQEDLLETVQAAATQAVESGVRDTAVAAATQIGDSGLQATLQAAATQIVLSPEDVPADIPIFEGEKTAFVGSPVAISYFVNASFEALLNYYQSEMPARGWSKIDLGTTVTDTTAELHFDKDGRKATVVIAVIPVVNQTSVVITIEE